MNQLLLLLLLLVVIVVVVYSSFDILVHSITKNLLFFFAEIYGTYNIVFRYLYMYITILCV